MVMTGLQQQRLAQSRPADTGHADQDSDSHQGQQLVLGQKWERSDGKQSLRGVHTVTAVACDVWVCL